MKKEKKIKSQNGRSMVEMLGVMAVAGVLTVGGVAGYRYAMTKQSANDFMQDFQIIMIESANWAATLPGRSAPSGGDTPLCGKGGSFKIGYNTNSFTAGDVVFYSGDGNYLGEVDGKLTDELPAYIQCKAYGSDNKNVNWNFLKELSVEGTPIIEIEIFTDNDMYYIYNNGGSVSKNMPDSFDDVNVNYIDFEFNTDLKIE